jgi:hypothetical protein
MTKNTASDKAKISISPMFGRGMGVAMDKLQLRGQNLGLVFKIRNSHLHAAVFLVSSVKLPNLQLKTRPKQLLGYLPLDITIPDDG